MGQHHPAQFTPGDAHIGGLHRDAEGEREVVEVPVIGVALLVWKAQQRLLGGAGVEQARIVQAEDGADQQPRAGHGEAGVQVV
ncbi:hypothetical protein D3C77_754620 [compost metagenome]